jgi:hypothetical protein
MATTSNAPSVGCAFDGDGGSVAWELWMEGEGSHNPSAAIVDKTGQAT